MNSQTEPRRRTSAGGDSRAVTGLGVAGGLLALLCVLSGVTMLLLKLAGRHPWPWLSQLTLVFLPIAFLVLIAALVLAVRNRRRV